MKKLHKTIQEEKKKHHLNLLEIILEKRIDNSIRSK